MGSGKKSTTKITGGKSIGERPIGVARIFRTKDTLIGECIDSLSPLATPLERPVPPVENELFNVSQELPRYTTVLSRSAEEGICMDDLDPLQQDLEKLLSTCALRQRVLQSEIDSVDQGKDKKSDKPPSPALKRTTPVKRKRIREKTKSSKDSKTIKRFGKSKHSTASLNDSPKIYTPRNDVCDRFWMFDPYCSDVSRENVCFLEDLLRDCSQEIDLKIPEVGEHYAYEWTEANVQAEQTTINGKIKKSNVYNGIKKNGVNNAILETLQSPLAQKLLDTLLEQKLFNNMPTSYSRLQPSDFGFKSMNGPTNGACLDEVLRKELVQEGILEIEDLAKPFPPDDEILREIKKCQQELSTLNRQNITELSKLRNIAENDLRRQNIKAALDKVDRQVIKLHHKMTSDAASIIEQQGILHRELIQLSDLSYLA